MKNKFENALLSNRMEDVEKGVDRVYFGNEFCENLIPSFAMLKKWYFFAKAGKKEFTFVSPFVTNRGLKKLEYLLAFLNEQRPAEIVFNDWGVFALVKNKFRGLIPVLGRLLTKQRRDPRMLKIFSGKQKFVESVKADKKCLLLPKRAPAGLFRHHQASIINTVIFQEYLLSEGINRVEIDNLAWEMKVKTNKKIGVSIYLPYGYITTSRMCGKLTLTYAACGKECKKYFFRLEDKTLPVPFYGIGNTVFYASKVPSEGYLRKLGIDRIVHQPRLPF